MSLGTGSKSGWRVLPPLLTVTVAWAATVLTAGAQPAGQTGGQQTAPAVVAGRSPIRDTGEPDAADPKSRPTARPKSAGEKPLRESEILAALPMTWDDPKALAVTAIVINQRLKQFEDRRQPFPWALAEGFRKSLLNGRDTAEKIEANPRIAYWQAVFMASLAAGRPADALSAARELIKLDVLAGWNYLSLYRAGMLCGDKVACTEAIEKMRPLIDPATVEGLNPMIWQAELVGAQPVFEATLFDGTRFSPGLVRGQTVVLDFWAQGLDTYTRIFPKIRDLHAAFKDYPGFKMVGVNMDAYQFRAVVNRFIQANEITWPQFYEGRQSDRPLSFKVFKVRLTPCLVVLSPTGKLIFQGQPNEPALYYAVRAGLMDANAGRIPTSQPEPAAGQVVWPFMPATTPTPVIKPPVKPAPATGAKPPAAPPAKAEREKAAWQLFNLAYAYERSEFKEKALQLYKEVLLKYPDSDAAVKARARLEVEY